MDLNWLVLTFFNLALALILFTSFLAFLRQDPLPVVLGITSRARYLEQRLGSYSEVVDKLNQLPETARIYFLWEPRSYGCTVDCWSDALLDRWLHQTQYYELEAGEIVKRWRNEGVTHILLYEDGLQFIKESSFDPIMPHDLQQLQILLENYMTEIWQVDKSYSLYRFNSPQ